MDRSLPRLLGGDVPYVNLDYAASTPVMAEVWEAVEAFIPGTAACTAAPA
jgi:hypothetical protein